MTPEQAVSRLQTILAHAWMVRAFLKHSDEIAEEEDLLEVHRTIFDYIRATEPAYQRGDFKEFLHRVKTKLGRLRRAAEHFAAEFRRVSDHTNFHMASASLTGCVKAIEEILAELKQSHGPAAPEAQTTETSEDAEEADQSR